MIPINENTIKGAQRIFLLLILISITLLLPWPHHNDDTPGSLLEWISAHLSSHKSNPKHATTTTHNHHSNHKHDHTKDDNINSLFLQGLARGFYDIGIVIVVWFTAMCLIGGACRVYLCMEECWNRRFYSVLPLYREHDDDQMHTSGDDDDDRSVEGEIVMREMREEERVERTDV